MFACINMYVLTVQIVYKKICNEQFSLCYNHTITVTVKFSVFNAKQDFLS